MIDGLSLTSLLELLLASHVGKTSLADNGDGTKTLTLYKQDGSTAKLAITFNAAGEWTETEIDPA